MQTLAEFDLQYNIEAMPWWSLFIMPSKFFFFFFLRQNRPDSVEVKEWM